MTPRDADATREALKGAARTLFARRGYEGTTIREIGRRTGLNTAMIAYHFGGKQGLFSTVVMEDLTAAQELLAASVREVDPPPERLRSFIRAFADVGKTRPAHALILVREQMDGGRHLERHVRDRFFGFFLHSRAIIEDGIRSGHFRRVDPHAAHLSLVGSLVYYMLTMPARETYRRQGGVPTETPSPDEYVRHVMELFSRGLER